MYLPKSCTIFETEYLTWKIFALVYLKKLLFKSQILKKSFNTKYLFKFWYRLENIHSFIIKFIPVAKISFHFKLWITWTLKDELVKISKCQPMERLIFTKFSLVCHWEKNQIWQVYYVSHLSNVGLHTLKSNIPNPGFLD